MLLLVHKYLSIVYSYVFWFRRRTSSLFLTLAIIHFKIFSNDTLTDWLSKNIHFFQTIAAIQRQLDKHLNKSHDTNFAATSIFWHLFVFVNEDMTFDYVAFLFVILIIFMISLITCRHSINCSLIVTNADCSLPFESRFYISNSIATFSLTNSACHLLRYFSVDKVLGIVNIIFNIPDLD